MLFCTLGQEFLIAPGISLFLEYFADLLFHNPALPDSCIVPADYRFAVDHLLSLQHSICFTA